MMTRDERSTKASEYAAEARKIADKRWHGEYQLGILLALNALYLQGTLD